jgi:hypothetical protein
MNAPVTREQILSQGRRETAGSQGTLIEQSRAIAEVQGALIVAQQRPRDETRALQRIREAGKQFELAERAFWKFPRGKETLVGESIHLAVEMARCWGNLNYGIVELSRMNERNESEMMAYAWDLETNTRSQMSFIVPHVRDTKYGPKALTDMRDIYENNANMGARRLRECIFRILPAHVIEIGKSTCIATLESGESEVPLSARLANMAEKADELGISRERIEAKLGSFSAMTAIDAASLHVSLRSVKRGEVSAEEEFPRVGLVETTEAARRIVDQAAGGEVNPAAQPAATEEAEPETGRADSDHGDQHDGTSADHPARKVADEIIRAAEVSPDLHHIAQLRGLREPDIAAMPDDLALEVINALNAAEKRLGGKK